MISPKFIKILNEKISSGSINDENKLWALGCYNGSINLFKENIEKPLILLGCQGTTRSLDFNLTGTKLLSSDQNGNFQITDINTQNKIYTKSKAHLDSLECCKFLNDNIIISGDSEGHVKVWDIRETHSIQKFHSEKDYVSDICIIDDKSFGISTGNGVLSLYYINRNKRKDFYKQEDDDFISTTYDSFSNYFIIASSKPKLYCCKNPSLDFVLETNLKSKRPFVFVNAFKTNKCRVVVGSDDGIIYISDIAPNHLIYAFQAHKKEISGGTLNGGHLLTWSSNNEFKIWDLSLKRDEEFISERKKKKLKKKKSIKIHDNNDTFFNELKNDSSD